jgi:hypothetical protein
VIEVLAGATFTAVAENADPGLVGTIGVAIEGADNNVISARTTDGIVESAPGIYVKDDLVAPDDTGTYLVIWDDGTDYASEELVVRSLVFGVAGGGGGGGLSRLISRPCLLVKRSASGDEDEYGNEIPSEELVETVCELQQATRAEPAAAGELSQTLWDFFFPTGTDCDTGDAVVVGANEYELVGEPWEANTGSRSVWHVEATARLVAGAEDVS